MTGLAQVSGRNNISWEDKFEYDLEYISNITFKKDLKIIFLTVFKVFNHADVTRDGYASDVDFGDWLLINHKIDSSEYERILQKTDELMKV